jgi:hypothetical protein
VGNQGARFAMISNRETSQQIEDQGTVRKAKYARFFWPILRGIALIVALWAFIAFLPVLLSYTKNKDLITMR